METSAGAILGGAFRLVRERPLAVGTWCLIYIAVTVAMAMLTSPTMMQPQFNRGGDPAANLAAMQSFFAQAALAASAMLLVYTLLYAAAQRAVLRPHDRAFAYLRFGMDELRLLAVSIILILAFVVIAIILAIPLFAIVGAAAMALGPLAVIPLVLLLYLVFFGVLVWLQVRFSLAFPLTLLRRRIVIGESWTLTKGRFWTLFGAYFALLVIFFCATMTVGLMSTASYWSDLMQGGFNPEAIDAASKRQIARQMSPDLVTMLSWVLSGLVGGLAVALFGGAFATAAKDLTGDVEGVAETFA